MSEHPESDLSMKQNPGGIPVFAFRAVLAALCLLAPFPAAAIEEAEYEAIVQEGNFEIREYSPSIVAQTVVDGDFEDASSRAFRTLFRYIDGENRSRDKIAMTAPVSQEPASEKIAMTAPVSQQSTGEGWVVSFMMPASYTMETIPAPLDPKVSIRLVPAWRAAAIRYSGRWTRENYQRHLDELRAWLEEQPFAASGPPVWARYNAPFTPWFLRRNEILVPVDRAGQE